MEGVKDQIMSLFKTKDYSKTIYGGGKKPSKSKIQKQSEENVIKSIRKLSKLKKKKNEANKDRIITDISTIFKQENDYYKSIRVGNLYPSKIDEWKASEKNNPTIALNILYIKEKNICCLYFKT